MDHSAPHDARDWLFASRWNIGLLALLAIGGLYLVTGHQAHLFAALPFLLILACPLMHFFMHGGHGGHGGHGARDGDAGSTGRQPGGR